MVRGEINLGGHMDLHIIQNGTLMAQRYIKKVLGPHAAQLVKNMLETETKQQVEWPVCIPNLNVIEHV